VLLSARHGRKGTLSPDTNQPPVAFAFQLKIIEMKSPIERPAGSFVSFFFPRPKMACRYKYAGQRVLKCHNLFVIRAVSFNLFNQVRTALVAHHFYLSIAVIANVAVYSAFGDFLIA
jgi:hypothetical protein